MKIRPQPGYLLIRMRNLRPETSLALPDNVSNDTPYGEVLDATVSSKFDLGDKVFFLPDNIVAGFNEKKSDECFIIPESCVFATLSL